MFNKLNINYDVLLQNLLFKLPEIAIYAAIKKDL